MAPAVPAAVDRLTVQDPPEAEPRVYHVLVTGFSQFRNLDPNPSWLAVKPLHNTVLEVPDAAAEGAHAESSLGSGRRRRPARIEIQVVQVPVAWRAVLDVVPRLHDLGRGDGSAPSPAAAPWLDPKGDTTGFAGDGRSFPTGYTHLRTPPGGRWDLILHVGTGRNGAVAIETLAHKEQYSARSLDVRGEKAPLIRERKVDGSGEASEQDCAGTHPRRPPRPSLMKRIWLRLLFCFHSPNPPDDAAVRASPSATTLVDKDEESMEKVPFYDPAGPEPNRGFGRGYEHGELEEVSLIDVASLRDHLEKLEHGPLRQSFDPGRYLCDFIYYASLAESRRGRHTQTTDRTGMPANGIQEVERAAADAGERASGHESKVVPVLFVHCPNVDQPHSSEQVSAVLRDAITWICPRYA